MQSCKGSRGEVVKAADLSKVRISARAVFGNKRSPPLGRITALFLPPLQAIQNFFILKLLGPGTDDVKDRLTASVCLSI